MQLTTLYNVGDTVWVLAVKSETAHVACTACTSTGKVTLEDVEYRCPKCGCAVTRTGVTKMTALSLVVDRAGACSSGPTECHARYFGTREDGKHVEVKEVDVFATKLLAEASLEH